MTLPKVTLTFDNGPWPGVTDRVLSVLDDFGMRATFFVVGQRIAELGGSELLVDIKRRGHIVGNHTWSHGEPLGRSAGTDHLEKEIGDTERLIGALAEPAPLFRPNGEARYGTHLLSHAAADFLSARRYTVVTWNCIPEDYLGDRSWIDNALRHIGENDWSVLVLHDIPQVDGNTLAPFLKEIEGNAEIVSGYPAECLPIIAGRRQAVLSEVVS